MKHTNKKGFTIVELVIVIAVIAILAAVLIPNLSRLVGKANESSDMQEARNVLSAYLIEEAKNDSSVDLILVKKNASGTVTAAFTVTAGVLDTTPMESPTAPSTGYTAYTGTEADIPSSWTVYVKDN